ncbi:unnamed protein product [Oppiella nova]|uniref:Uncharacterized protein n=1 Tax=Oppiella nova TaxID=334625 RepID=A0A7R9LDJ7_9ACAR|nr:unnamed protein product [Oppiella nova]CAG2162560.1 unnamed protein product [Oppiella nova]
MILNIKVIHFVLLLVVIGCVSGNHKPSPHKFDCPPKKVPGGMKEVMTCAAKFKFMLDQVCKPKYGLPNDLVMNLAKHVFFHAIKCIDEDYEHFLIDGAIDCFVGDGSPGAEMMCNIKTSMCNAALQTKVVGCAMKEAKMHTIDMAKLMSMIGHIGKLCNILAVSPIQMVVIGKPERYVL